MYAFIRAILDSIISFLASNAGKGKLGEDAKTEDKKLRTAGSRIRDYIRLRGMQSGNPDSRIKPD